jgi:predicted ATPase
MPLGIVLAAGWIDVLSPEEIAAEIAQTLDLLKTEMVDVPKRQRSIRAMFESSWNLLTGEERDALARISVFRGGCSRRAARQVTGASLSLLTALVSKSLPGRSAATGNFEIHELVRQYADEYLDASGAANTVRDSHCVHYAKMLRRSEDALVGHGQLRAMDEIRSDIDNARAAWKQHEYDESKRRAEEALAIFEEVDNRWGMALSLQCWLTHCGIMGREPWPGPPMRRVSPCTERPVTGGAQADCSCAWA